MKFWCALLVGFAVLHIAHAQEAPLNPLSANEKALLDSVIRNCGRRDVAYRDDLVGGQTADRVSLAKQEESVGDYRFYYAPEMWRVIAAAAQELQRLDWVVTDGHYSDSRLNDRVISREQFENLRTNAGDKLLCFGADPVPMCDESERRIAREIFGFELSPCGEEMPWDRHHPNALRPQHVRMIQALLDNGYVYDPATRKFQKELDVRLPGPDYEPAAGTF